MLSSPMTFLLKFGVPAVYSAFLVRICPSLVKFVRIAHSPTLPAWTLVMGFVCALFVPLAPILAYCAGLKRLRMDHEFLYVSNYRKEIAVPLRQVGKITQVDLGRRYGKSLRQWTIHFRSPTEFGPRIVFRVKEASRGISSRDQPVIERIRRGASLNRRQAGLVWSPKT